MLLNVSVNAHVDILDVTYDNCINDPGDGVDEKWYDLIWFDSVSNTSISHHIPSYIETIKYFIEDDSDLDWTNETGEHKNEILAALNAGIQMWNEVYFYDKENGITTKKKIITLIEGTENDNNIVIRDENSNYLGYTLPDFSSIALNANVNGDYFHRHYNDWEVYINVELILEESNDDYTFISRNIAHEIGHILGLCDVDENENSNNSNWHHEELLMGYAQNGELNTRQQSITYKDLAGVAITRGFHTDSDHRWLVDTDQLYNGQYKKICSICNGIEYVSSLSGIYHEYNYCQGVHTLSSNNMLAVGCNGDQDFIKCKYCRYVAPVEDMVTQNYTYQTYDSYQHKLINTVSGLGYTIYEDHSYTYSQYSDSQHKSTCLCGYVTYEGHIFTPLPYNQEKHRLRCTCGYVAYQNHSITETDYSDGDSTALCIICKGFININNGIFDILPNSITKYSINGSFILPNGVVVLVDEDIESYLNNTLIFYEEEDLPQIE